MTMDSCDLYFMQKFAIAVYYTGWGSLLKTPLAVGHK